MSRIDIGSAVERIIAAVADEHGLVGVSDAVTRTSRLNEDLGMDEVDIIAIICRAEDRFGVVLPDDRIEPSSTVADIVALVTERLHEKHAGSALPTEVPDLAGIVGRRGEREFDRTTS